MEGKKFRQLAEKYHGPIVEWRRNLHRLAEPAFKETKTAAYLAAELEKMGVTFQQNIGGTGIVALLEAERDPQSVPTVALRADMDALPMEEQTGLPFASENPGYMHACGHDAHMAMLLGVPLMWRDLKEKPPGNLMLIFQPAEESPPGGAKAMLADGVFNDVKPEAIFAFHVNPYLPPGAVGLKEGPLMAAADSFALKVIGKGGHAAAPHHAVDAITVSSNIVQSWQQVVSRMVDPQEPLVLTIGTIRGGHEFNIIAGEVELKGTVRTLQPALQEKMPGLLESMAQKIGEAFGAHCEFQYHHGYPVLENDAEKTECMREAVKEICGPKMAVELSRPMMGGEDMAFFMQQIPGCYALLGTGFPQGEKQVYPWHNPCFNLNEEALSTGSALLAGAAWLALEKR